VQGVKENAETRMQGAERDGKNEGSKIRDDVKRKKKESKEVQTREEAHDFSVVNGVKRGTDPNGRKKEKPGTG